MKEEKGDSTVVHAIGREKALLFTLFSQQRTAYAEAVQRSRQRWRYRL